MSNNNNSLNALSPLDGRYHSQLEHLSQLFSEFSLIKSRLFVEIKYILFLSENSVIENFSKNHKQLLLNLQDNFDEAEALKLKEIEKKVKHDVKAVEYYLRDFFIEKDIPNAQYIHFALTSEDTNSMAYGVMLKKAQHEVLLPSLKIILTQLLTISEKYAGIAMLAKTHGQPAVPTTVGKELLVYAQRLHQEVQQLEQHTFAAKMTGAVGNFNAHVIAFPDHNWPKLSTQFINSLNLEASPITTQIVPSETYTQFFGTLIRVNLILIDLNQDIWRYISDRVFLQKVDKNQVGSSTMPQKVNPIDFENSEGNLGLANALLDFFVQKLPVSRLQRDLSDSTVKRNFGVAFGHCHLAYTSLNKGLKKISPNTDYLAEELDQHWEVVAEGIQVVLKTHGVDDAYEQLKSFSKGSQLTKKDLQTFIGTLAIESEVIKKLLAITPQSYTGLAEKIVLENVKSIKTKYKDSK